MLVHSSLSCKPLVSSLGNEIACRLSWKRLFFNSASILQLSTPFYSFVSVSIHCHSSSSLFCNYYWLAINKITANDEPAYKDVTVSPRTYILSSNFPGPRNRWFVTSVQLPHIMHCRLRWKSERKWRNLGLQRLRKKKSLMESERV